MDAIASLADRYSFGELRVSHEQNLVLADVRSRDLAALWRAGQPPERIMEERRAADSAAGRNDPCPCGSGRKFKRCCLGRATPAP